MRSRWRAAPRPRTRDPISALIAHLTAAAPADYAPDISGVNTTTMQIGAAVGVVAP